MYPRGDRDDDKDYISIYLDSVTGIFQARVQFSITDKQGRILYFACLPGALFKANKDSWGFRKFKHNECLMDDNLLTTSADSQHEKTLTVVCEIIFDASIERGPIFKLDNEPWHEQMRDFEKLIDDEQYSDIILTIKEKKIHAHKNILAARSPVFAEIFTRLTCDLQENERPSVPIQDTNYYVMRELLRFIYAGTVDDIDGIARELFIAADKYSINTLKIECESRLIQNIHNETVFDYLNLASLHNAPNLKDRCMEFFKTNVKRIVQLSDFKLSQFDKNIVDDVFQVIADSWRIEN
ncbi:hypothetical protein QAD02_011024 [Eretmocerus hayati]|uniref:Uncharacterized protein n=1 Tax=Eretmocerus hayati TaxID=131215 RepID=A0ACC2NWJ6_9HYME|nr:hypothetical protein QAD02_011024 [Eretmocerus hayati]